MSRTLNLSRRDVVRLTLGAAFTVAAACGTCRRAAAAENKLAKAAVQYAESGAPPGMDCDDCTQFVPGKTAKDPASCKIVEGDISPHGHCIAFSPKPKR